ncbi:MAG: flagellar hook-basal body complex protein FliE [Erythrobacter sp.]|nr:flagellar hook-basal body complex protein FliE [Erythrobacter sp.]
MSAIGSFGSGFSVQQIMDLRGRMIDGSSSLRDLHSSIGGQTGSDGKAGGGFEATLRGMVEGVNNAQQRAGDVSAAYQRGEITDVAQVMLARQEAGVSFEATLQVRNKLLSAYQEIMRMGV